MALQKNLFEYLEHSAAQYGDKVAFADPKNAYTFRSLLHAAEAIGTFIMTRTNALNRPIAILVERSSLSLAGFMGILASGNYYVPIDRDMPPRRLEMILRQLRPAALLGPRDAEEDMDHFAAMCPVFTLEEAQRANPVTMFLTARRQMVLDIDPAYVIYTSGSTGAPKGIVISHRAVIDFTEWMADTFRFTDEDILGNQAPFYFDLSVKDIYQGLRCGCTVHIFPQEYVLLPERLLAFADDYGITSFIWSTSSFNQLANSGALAKAAPRWLKRVIVGGEPMRARELNIWRAALPDVQYVNLYGPTEVTVDCTYYIVNKEFADDEMIPIGRPCLNKQVMLLDDDLNFVKRGQIGEICVRGIGLAKGYYNDPDKTAAAFIQNPASWALWTNGASCASAPGRTGRSSIWATASSWARSKLSCAACLRSKTPSACIRTIRTRSYASTTGPLTNPAFSSGCGTPCPITCSPTGSSTWSRCPLMPTEKSTEPCSKAATSPRPIWKARRMPTLRRNNRVSD